MTERLSALDLSDIKKCFETGESKFMDSEMALLVVAECQRLRAAIERHLERANHADLVHGYDLELWEALK